MRGLTEKGTRHSRWGKRSPRAPAQALLQKLRDSQRSRWVTAGSEAGPSHTLFKIGTLMGPVRAECDPWAPCDSLASHLG